MLLSWTNDLNSSLLVKQVYDWKSQWLKKSHRLLANIFWSRCNFFFRGGIFAVIKPNLSRNLVKPAAAVNYPASRN